MCVFYSQVLTMTYLSLIFQLIIMFLKING